MTKKRFVKEFKNTGLVPKSNTKEKRDFIYKMVEAGELEALESNRYYQKGMYYYLSIDKKGTAKVKITYTFYIQDDNGNLIRNNGKPKQFNITGLTCKECRDKAKEAEREQREKGFITPTKLTFGQQIENYLQEKQGELRENTFFLYEQIVKANLKPSFIWNMELQEITPKHIKELYRTIAGETVKRKGKVSKSFLGNVRAVISPAMNEAVAEEVIKNNPVSLAKFPTDLINGNGNKEEKKEADKFLKKDEVEIFKDYAKQDRFYLVYQIALNTGMRKGEIFGITWENVDLEKGLIKVNKVIRRAGNCYILSEGAKTEKSNRSIKISKDLVKELKQYKLQQKQNKNNLVFSNNEGKPVSLENFEKRSFKKIMKQIKKDYPEFSNITFHSLRHTFASYHIQAHKDIFKTSKILGHSSITLTADIYGHLLPQDQEEVIDIYNKEAL